MNTKIKKVIREIEQTEAKIAELQEKLTLLNDEKIELENLEIIGMFRNAKVTTYNIAEVMEAFKTFHKQDGMPNVTPKKEMEDLSYEEN